MQHVPYPRHEGKLVILLGGEAEHLRRTYLEEHAARLAAISGVQEYRANIKAAPDPNDPTAATNGTDPYGVLAIDEIKGASPQFSWKDVEALYRQAEAEGFRLIGAYSVTEYMVRELYTCRPTGIRSPEVKRIALLTRPEGKSHADAMQYWITQHPLFCFRHHTGMAAYSQYHINQRLTPDSPELDGFPILSYWNADAFRYGHFSREDTKDLMMEDCRGFRSTSFVVSVEEYVMKRPLNWRER